MQVNEETWIATEGQTADKLQCPGVESASQSKEGVFK